MGAENFAKVMQQGKRSVKRARVLLTAHLETSAGKIEAKLRDLSQKGALVECDNKLELNSELVFSRGKTVVPARVAWISGKKVGLEFVRAINESEVLVQPVRPAPAPAATPAAVQAPYRRGGLRVQALSAEERKLAEVWGISVGIAVPD